MAQKRLGNTELENKLVTDTATETRRGDKMTKCKIQMWYGVALMLA